MLQKLTLLFPLWMILLCATALIWPEGWMFLNQGPVVVLILGFVMLCMGLTLTVDDFRRITRIPKAVAVGFAAQAVDAFDREFDETRKLRRRVLRRQE